jgi:hypothetical protein
MKVTLATHGGLAATINRGREPRGVDGDSLSGEEAQELARLVAAAEAEPAPEEHRAGNARDAISYTITVENDGRSIRLTRSDATMSRGFSELRRWLEDHSPNT